MFSKLNDNVNEHGGNNKNVLSNHYTNQFSSVFPSCHVTYVLKMQKKCSALILSKTSGSVCRSE